MAHTSKLNILACDINAVGHRSKPLCLLRDALQSFCTITYCQFDDVCYLTIPSEVHPDVLVLAGHHVDDELLENALSNLDFLGVVVLLSEVAGGCEARINDGEVTVLASLEDWKQFLFILKVKCHFQANVKNGNAFPSPVLDDAVFQKVIGYTKEGVVTVSLEGDILFCNVAAQQLLGLNEWPAHLTAINLCRAIKIVKADGIPQSDFFGFWLQAVDTPYQESNISFVNLDNRLVHVVVKTENLVEGNTRRILLVLEDVTEKVLLQRKHEQLDVVRQLQEQMRQIVTENLAIEAIYAEIFCRIIKSGLYPLNGRGCIYCWHSTRKQWQPIQSEGGHFVAFSPADLQTEYVGFHQQDQAVFTEQLSSITSCLSQPGSYYLVPLIGQRENGELGLLVLGASEQCCFNGMFIQNIREIAQSVSQVIEGELNRQLLRKLSAVVEQSPYSILITDSQGIIEYANAQLCATSGYALDEVIGQTPRLFHSGNTPRSTYTQLWRTITHGGMWKGEVQNRKKNGELIWESVQIQGLRGSQGDITHFVGIRSDITARKLQEAQLESLVHYDALTGLPNRTLTLDRLTQLVEQSREQREPLSIICILIDQYELIENSMGEYYSDLLVMAVLDALRRLVPANVTIGRPDKKQMVILLYRSFDDASLAMLSEKIVDQLHMNIALDDNYVQATCSVGICLFDQTACSAEVLLRASSVAAYRAHEQGGSQYQIYRPSFDVDLQQIIVLRSEITRAIERQEFFVVYQPQIDLRNGSIVGCEALIRWQHPERGLVSPAEFIPVAEESGLIRALGAWVIQEVCRQIRLWQEAGIRPFQVSVNVSVKQLRESEFVSHLVSVVEEYGIDPKWLDIELTESVVMESPQSSIALLNSIREAGFGLTVDDFGTGYSSLSYLKQLPIDRVKIDRSFVINLHRDPNDAAIANAIVALSHKLGLVVLAEGVEEETQLTYLARNHCDQIQGYYFSRPMTPGDLEAMLRIGYVSLPYLKPGIQGSALLLVDDEINVLKALQRLFRQEGYPVFAAQAPRAAFDILAKEDIGVILCDQRMPEMYGTEFMAKVKGLYPDTVRIILSGHADLNTVTAAINEGAIYKFYTKPWDDAQLRKNIREAFDYNLLLKHRQAEGGGR